MSEGKKPTSRPPTHPGDVPPSHVSGQAEFTEQIITLSQCCQVPPTKGESTLSPGEADNLFHTLLGHLVHVLATHAVNQVDGDRMLSSSHKQLLAAAKKRRLHSNERSVEFLAEALASRVAGLKVFPETIKLVAAKSKEYARRFAGSATNAEDCLQAALLLVHQNPGQFGAFTSRQALGVLCGITRNMQRKEFRDQRRLILTEGEEVAEPTASAVSNGAGDYLETRQIAALLESQAPQKVRIAIEFMDRKTAGEDLDRTTIERASRARDEVAAILETCGVDTRHVYRRRRSRSASSVAKIEQRLVQPSNDNAQPEPGPIPVEDSAPILLEEQPPPSSRVRRRS